MTLEQENKERAQRGRNIMDAYAVEIACSGHVSERLRDLLADLMHMAAADCECPEFETELDAARMHFEAETTAPV